MRIPKGLAYDSSAPGVYIQEVESVDNNILVNNFSVPFVVGTAGDGSVTEIVTVYRVSELLSTYGSRAGGNLVKFAETLLNEGAGLVRCYRLAGSGAAKASRTISAGSGTTWKFEAAHVGLVGNDITVQVLDGTLTSTVNVTVIKNGVSYSVENVTNTSTDARYIGTIWDCDWVTFTKTGTATTLPSVDGAAVAMTGGLAGSDPADGDYVTALAAAEADLTIDLVACACAASASIRTGLKNHCTLMQNRIYFMAPVTDDTVAHVLTEVAGYDDEREVIVYPSLNYYNIETAATEVQDCAWFMGVCASVPPNISPANKKVRSGTLTDTLTRAEKISLNTSHVSVGAPNSKNLWYTYNAKLTYRDAFWGLIQIRRIYDKIEATIDETLEQYVGYHGSLNELKSDLIVTMTAILNTYKKLGYLYDYIIDVQRNTESTRQAGEAYCDVYLQVYQDVEKIFVKVGKLSDYSVVIREE